MKAWQKIILLVVVLAGSWMIYFLYENPGRNDTDFQNYKKQVLYCSQFFGGQHESNRQIYENWKNHQLIGC
jgi:hypothetical protein